MGSCNYKKKKIANPVKLVLDPPVSSREGTYAYGNRALKISKRTRELPYLPKLVLDLLFFEREVTYA